MIKNTANSGVYTDPAYRIAKSMYVALGGDPATEFESVDAIYAEINGIYESTGSRVNIEALKVQYNENGLYEFDNDEVTGYKPVSIEVAVAQKYTDEQVIELQSVARTEGYNNGYQDGFTTGSDDGYQDGYAEGLDDGFIDGVEDQKAKLTDITIDANGTYTAEDGYKTVNVKIESSGLDFSPLGYDTELSKTASKYITDQMAYSEEFAKSWNPSNKSLKFTGEYFPNIDISNVTGGVYDCSFGDNVKIIPDVTINLNTLRTSRYAGVFYGLMQLRYLGYVNAPNNTALDYMFNGLGNVEYIGGFNSPLATGGTYMFNGCPKLKYIGPLNIGQLTSLQNTFYDCKVLTAIPAMDTSNVTNMDYAFYQCQSLTAIPAMDTSNVTTADSAFYYCMALTTIPLLDFGNVTKVSSMLYGCRQLTTLGGFKDLGKQSSITGLDNTNFLYQCTKLTYDSLMNVINNLYDRASNGLSVLTLKMHPDQIAKLSEADIAIATNKGWTIA